MIFAETACRPSNEILTLTSTIAGETFDSNASNVLQNQSVENDTSWSPDKTDGIRGATGKAAVLSGNQELRRRRPSHRQCVLPDRLNKGDTRSSDQLEEAAARAGVIRN